MAKYLVDMRYHQVSAVFWQLGRGKDPTRSPIQIQLLTIVDKWCETRVLCYIGRRIPEIEEPQLYRVGQRQGYMNDCGVRGPFIVYLFMHDVFQTIMLGPTPSQMIVNRKQLQPFWENEPQNGIQETSLSGIYPGGNCQPVQNTRDLSLAKVARMFLSHC